MKLEEIVNVLKERYIGTNQKAYLFSELKEQNPDLPFSELPNLIKEVHNQSPRGYLTSIGILSEYGEAAETAEKFKDNLPFEEMYNIYLEEYKKQTVDNPYFDITIPKNQDQENCSRNSKADVQEETTYKDGMKIVGTRLVKYEGSDKKITIPEGVEEIGLQAFCGNTNIETVELPKSIKVIGEDAFYDCKHLSEVIFNSEAEPDSIYMHAFANCTKLKKINLPKTINFVGMNAFSRCTILNRNAGFKTIGHVLMNYSGHDTVVNIPEGITVIGEYAFHMCDELEYVNLSGVTHINEAAFSSCDNLKEVVLSEKLEEIGRGAFAQCDELKLIGTNGLPTTLPKGLKEIKNAAFAGCRSLKEITIPGSVKKIGFVAFSGCSDLSKVILEEGIEEIRDNAFKDTPSLSSINIPTSVKHIGKDAFIGCGCSKNIALPEAFRTNKGYYGIPDENGCFVSNGTLIGYALENKKTVQITDGIVAIEENSLDSIFSDTDNVSQIILPNSVREIRHLFYGEFKMNIPCGYLLQKRKLPVKPLKILLDSVWEDNASMPDWVSVYIYQKNKALSEYCNFAFEAAPNAFIVSALIVLGDDCKPKDVDRVGEAVFELCNNKRLKQEFLDKFYVFAKEHKGKKAVSALTPYASASVGGEPVGGKLNENKEYQNELEEYCDKYYNKKRVLERIDSLSIFEQSGVKYSDRDEDVSAFVLACAILPYVDQLTYLPSSTDYKTAYSEITFLKDCDWIASNFEKKSFETFIEKISTNQLNTICDIYEWAIPVCRFGSGHQIKTLISKMKLLDNWAFWGRNGREAIIFCRGAIMLSDSREAIMYAEKCKCLDYYASLRGTTADIIRDTNLADFGFNSDGKKLYDLGNTVIEATIEDDLTIRLFDTNASKFVKSLPKKGCDKEKYDACSADYSEMKKNVKKVIKTRNNLLFECFLSGKKFDYKSWTAAYQNNPVLNKVAKLLVWAQEKQTFTLSDTGAIDSFGNSFVINPSEKIVVAHPLEMNDKDIACWQKYFTERKLKQPFEQIWEPKVKEDIQENRYAGCMLPYYRFLNQEKHGITVTDQDYHDDIDITFQDCDATVVRIDWARHSIDVTDRFEITSISLKSLNRKTNHIIYYLDKCTIFGRIEQDDASALQNLEGYTVAQIDSFLKYAVEKESTKCTALLLNYKNERFADFANIDEFTLDF